MEDLTNQEFGHLTVLKLIRKDDNRIFWLCQCDCKNKTQIIVDGYRLKTNNKTHCGCQKQYGKKQSLPVIYRSKKKTCTQCNEIKNYADFYYYKKYNSNHEGYYYFHPKCKECTKKNSRDWILQHPEQRKEQLKRHDATDVRFKGRQISNARRRKEGKEKIYRQQNKDKIRQYNLQRKNKNHQISKQEWKNCKNYFNNSCAYCGISEQEAKLQQGQNLHKEHVVHTGANDLSNCVPACRSCNSHKWKFKIENWYNKDNPNFNENKLNKIYKWLNEDYKKYINKKTK